MSEDYYSISGYFMDYNSVEKVIPYEFNVLEQKIDELRTYFAIQGKHIRQEEIVVYMEDGHGDLDDDLDDDELVLVKEKMQESFDNLKKAFFDKTQLNIWFYYSGTNDVMYVKFHDSEVFTLTPQAKALQSLNVGFGFDEWVESV
jgi:hypothetical protein